MWYTTAHKPFKPANYTSTVPPSMTPEKKALYELSVVMETHVDKGRLPFSIGYISSMKDKLTVDLKQSKIENQMRDGPETSADGILISLNKLYSEAVNKEVPVDEREEMNDGEMEDADNPEASPPPSRPKLDRATKKKVHEKMGEDIGALGMEKLLSRNILTIRDEKRRIAEEKCLLRKCIVSFLSKPKPALVVDLMTEEGNTISWQKYMRSRCNNLELSN